MDVGDDAVTTNFRSSSYADPLEQSIMLLPMRSSLRAKSFGARGACAERVVSTVNALQMFHPDTEGCWTALHPKSVSTRLRLTAGVVSEALALFQTERYSLGVHANDPEAMSH